MTEKKKTRFSLSTNILIGMFLGIVCGIFFGEKVAFLQVAGNAFIKLLQMMIFIMNFQEMMMNFKEI